jgi:hypothetical protein
MFLYPLLFYPFSTAGLVLFLFFSQTKCTRRQCLGAGLSPKYMSCFDEQTSAARKNRNVLRFRSAKFMVISQKAVKQVFLIIRRLHYDCTEQDNGSDEVKDRYR